MDEITVIVTPVEVTAVVSNTGIQGPKGDPGSGATDNRIHLIGDTTSAGTAGVSIPVTGMTLADDYVAFPFYLENPQGNGVLYAEQTASEFTIKHAGSHLVKVGYVVFKKVA